MRKGFSLFCKKARKKLFKGLRYSSRLACTDSTKLRANRALEFCDSQRKCFCSQTNKNCALLLLNVAILLWLWLLFEQQISCFEAPVKMPRNTFCVVFARHDLRTLLPRSYFKSFWFFFQKEHTSFLNFLTDKSIFEHSTNTKIREQIALGFNFYNYSAAGVWISRLSALKIT